MPYRQGRRGNEQNAGPRRLDGMNDGPRLRFSPAPTGYLHVGSARSALFNWLAASSAGGRLMLRVEDTNAELYRPEYLDSILDTLEWLGITFDGEPLFQS